MKVIKEGAKHRPKWLGRWECPTCGSCVELEEGDDVDGWDEQRDGYMVAFRCPICGNCPRSPMPAGSTPRRLDRDMPCIYASRRCAS